MKNFIQPGKHLTIASSPIEAKSGELVEIGDLVGVAITDAGFGEELVLSVDGVFNLPKFENQNIEAFRNLSFDDGRLTADTTKGKICAFSVEEAKNPSSQIQAKLFGFSLPPIAQGAEPRENSFDPLNLAKKRTATFYNRKIVLSSTPGNKYVPGEGGSRIEFAWLGSDQRHYLVPCPHCKHDQMLKWEQVRWNKDSEVNDLTETAYYECESCKNPIQESSKMAMLKAGYWQARRPTKGIAGFHLNELYSPWKTWREVVEDYLEAKDDIELYKVWVNTSLGLPFENKGGDQPEWKALYQRRENRPEGVIPPEVVLLTAGVDVQKDRLEISIIGWNRKQSWLIEHKRLFGDTASEEVWRELDELLDTDYEHPNGEAIRNVSAFLRQLLRKFNITFPQLTHR